jgi:formylglycine-generating enzyme required for sulfatase activity
MSENRRLLSILSDQPADEDRLDFDPCAQTLADVVADPDTDTPLTIGIFGGWGRGKTSLMRMVRRRLEATAESEFPVRTVWFNAWLYNREEALWRALISRVLDAARTFPTLDEAARDTLRGLEARLYPPTAPPGGHLTLAPGALAGLDGGSLPTLTGLELLRRQAERGGDAEAAARLQELIADVEESQALTRRDQIAALDQFHRQFERISRTCIVPHGRLAVFVDDLDRCLPDQAIEVLEAVKLFLDVPGCIFVLGIDREVIEQGIRVRYADYEARIDGALYMEKIIQIPFNLPPISTRAVEAYVQGVTFGGLPDPHCERVFAVGLEPNPRRIKRTLNIFLLLWRLAQNREDLRDTIKPVRLAKMVVIQQYHPRLFALVQDGPHHLIDLERRFRQAQQARHGEEELPLPRSRKRGPGGEEDEVISAGPLAEFLGRGLLSDLLTCTAPDAPDANFTDLTPARVLEYIFLTRSTVEEETVEAEASRLLFEPQMVTMPAGPFLMGTPQAKLDELLRLMKEEYEGVEREWVEREIPQHEVTLDRYAISRYPVTVAEFARFVEDGGYATREHWTEAGWMRRESEGWTQPRYWEDEKWNDPSQPVVGVSWYEALAYCNWLADKTGRAYRLPTEAEWEKAARSTDGRRYPWGNDWDPSHCNNEETGPGHTTPVGQYPQGDSSYGVSEMVGQVWEWCSSKYSPYRYDPDDGREDLEGEDTRINRGGSWNDGAGWCRCGYRSWRDPGRRRNNRGFRCVRTLSS